VFLIQLGHIKIRTIPKQEFKTVPEIFLSLYDSEEEQFFVIWKELPIAFNYKSQLFQNFDAVLSMCWLLRKKESGDAKVQLENDALTVKLQLHWSNDQLKIEAHFDAKEDHFRRYSETLQQKQPLILSKINFLREWNTLLRQVMLSIQASGCTVKDGTERRKLELLQETERNIAGYGKFYHYE